MNDIKLRILGLLSRVGISLTSYSIAKELCIYVPQAEHHLKSLTEIGLVVMVEPSGNKNGRKKMYQITSKKNLSHKGLVFSFIDGGPIIIHCDYYDKCQDRTRCGEPKKCKLYEKNPLFRKLWSN